MLMYNNTKLVKLLKLLFIFFKQLSIYFLDNKLEYKFHILKNIIILLVLFVVTISVLLLIFNTSRRQYNELSITIFAYVNLI